MVKSGWSLGRSSVDSSQHPSLEWWSSNILLQGRPFIDPDLQLTITTDASLTIWGASTGLDISGHVDILPDGSPDQLPKADGHPASSQILLARLQQKVVLIKTDNMTAMYYLQKQEDTHSTQLSA